MKKLALIVIVAALSMVPAVTLADGNGGMHFSGIYEMSASGSCLHSENGYTIGSNGWYSAKSGVVYAGTTVANGTWVFKQDGTGTYSYLCTLQSRLPRFSQLPAPSPVGFAFDTLEQVLDQAE